MIRPYLVVPLNNTLPAGPRLHLAANGSIKLFANGGLSVKDSAYNWNYGSRWIVFERTTAFQGVHGTRYRAEKLQFQYFAN